MQVLHEQKKVGEVGEFIWSVTSTWPLLGLAVEKIQLALGGQIIFVILVVQVLENATFTLLGLLFWQRKQFECLPIKIVDPLVFFQQS